MGCKDHFSHLQVLVEVLDHHDAVLVVTSLLGYVVLNLKIQKSVEFSIDMPYLQNLMHERIHNRESGKTYLHHPK